MLCGLGVTLLLLSSAAGFVTLPWWQDLAEHVSVCSDCFYFTDGIRKLHIPRHVHWGSGAVTGYGNDQSRTNVCSESRIYQNGKSITGGFFFF